MNRIIFMMIIFLPVILNQSLSLNGRLPKIRKQSRAIPHRVTSFQNLTASKKCSCGHLDCGKNSAPKLGKILGGWTAEKHAYPWVAFITIGPIEKIFCGGTLINNLYLLTAAHCFIKRPKRYLPYMKVHLGKHHSRLSRNTKQEKKIKDFWMHNDFVLESYENDIAIIELDSPVKINDYVRPICFPETDEIPYGEYGTVVGWGRTAEDGSQSMYPKQIKVPIWKNSDCIRQNKYDSAEIFDEMFCAGFEFGLVDACLGDSGVPLMTPKKSKKNDKNDSAYIAMGIVSWSYGCGRKGYPGVYTRVAKYKQFILEHVDKDCLCYN